ncbi:MAG: DUF262 domain-containing protein [Puniceicoccaceae bacterium]|nr:MAG: DUF262 domain-containing protein [Puniceicoccaceae bacterium]
MTQNQDFSFSSIKEILSQIGGSQSQLYLPSIQRHFVWKPEKICKMFDSLMRGYPIGTFLFWEVPDEKRHDYAFYQFIQHYSEFDNYENDVAPVDLPKGIIGILDGQQRLNSMFVALSGSYCEFNNASGAWTTKSYNYDKKHFYINLLGTPDEDDHWAYDFRFLSDDEHTRLKKNHTSMWCRVGKAMHWEGDDEVAQALNELTQGHSYDPEQTEKALDILKHLKEILQKEDAIAAFWVRNKELSEALEIFIRVNRGGIQLSSMDLYFSTIAAFWKEGRYEVEKFLGEINSVSDRGFNFEISSLVLASLALSDGPIQLNVESFGPKHVEAIKSRWTDICNHMMAAAELLHTWGFDGNNNISIHAGLPVALAHKSGYDMSASAEELRRLVIRSLISDFYARGTSRRNKILIEIREFMAKDAERHKSFNLERLMGTIKLPVGISFQVIDETIEELLTTEIWKPKAYLLLSLLHGHHALHQTYFDKDHIHPQKKFSDLSQYDLAPEEEAQWREKRDQLPNIQLLQGSVNRSKQDEPFADWLNTFRPDKQQRDRYLDENDIPTDCSLDFKDFPKLFEKRKELLRKKLYAILGAKNPTVIKAEPSISDSLPS